MEIPVSYCSIPNLQKFGLWIENGKHQKTSKKYNRVWENQIKKWKQNGTLPETGEVIEFLKGLENFCKKFMHILFLQDVHKKIIQELI